MREITSACTGDEDCGSAQSVGSHGNASSESSDLDEPLVEPPPEFMVRRRSTSKDRAGISEKRHRSVDEISVRSRSPSIWSDGVNIPSGEVLTKMGTLRSKRYSPHLEPAESALSPLQTSGIPVIRVDSAVSTV